MKIRVLLMAQAVALACAWGTTASATLQVLANASFETPDPTSGANPSGWQVFNQARYRVVGDGLSPTAVAHSGTRAIDLPSGGDFVGYSTDGLFDSGDLGSGRNNPGYLFGIDQAPVTVSAWFYISSSDPFFSSTGFIPTVPNPTDKTTRAGLKLEFRRTVNNSVYQSVEWKDIDPTDPDIATKFPGIVQVTDAQGHQGIHTGNQWIKMTRTFDQNSGPFIDSGTMTYYDMPPVNPDAHVSILPFRFGPPPAVAFNSGTVFFDDISFSQSVPCKADIDGSGSVTVSDIFAFLRAWFAKGAGSDFDGNGTTNVSDIFAFLRAWFAKC